MSHNLDEDLLNEISSVVTNNKSLKEARDPGLTYTEKKVKDILDRVTTELSGKQAENFTKLGKKYYELKAGIEAVEKLQEELNAQIKDKLRDLFNAEDEVLTRVAETAQFTLTLSKKPEATETKKTNYDKVIAELLKLQPELQKQVDGLIEQFTEVKKNDPKPETLRVAMKESAIGNVFQKLLNKFKSFLNSVKNWGSSYDKKLDRIKSMSDNIK